MSVKFTQPEFSFVRFDPDVEDTEINNDSFCKAPHLAYCLPISDQDDISFQIIADADIESEADSLCDIGNNKVQIGLVAPDADYTNVANWLVNYTTHPSFMFKPDRFRIGPKRLLYNWNGAPAFEDYVDVGECFRFVVRVVSDHGTFYGRTNCFTRIPGDECFTSVIYYGSSRNSYGFIYCGYYEDEAAPVDPGSSPSCEATIKNFSNQSIVNIPYTPTMKTMYGDVPTVDVYIYDIGTGKFIKTIVAPSLDNIPPTNISVDLGGPASGYIKIY